MSKLILIAEGDELNRKLFSDLRDHRPKYLKVTDRVLHDAPSPG